MDILTAIPWGTVTPGMLLALTVVLIIRGDIHTHREVIALIEERNHWRDVAMTLLKAATANTESAKVIAQMFEVMEQTLKKKKEEME